MQSLLGPSDSRHGTVVSLSDSAVGHSLAAGLSSGAVGIIDVRKPEGFSMVHIRDAHAGAACSAQLFSAAGRTYCASGGEDGKVLAAEVGELDAAAADAPLQVYSDVDAFHGDYVRDLSVRPNTQGDTSQLLSCAWDGGVKLLEFTHDAVLRL